MMNTPTSKDLTEKEKVIVGKNGWLFLGNDSNNSCAQFIGEINLEPHAIDKFKSYLEVIKKKISCDFFFSIAPNKEFVLPEMYPFTFKEKCNGNPLVHEQVLTILKECEIRHHYPANELAEIPKSYYKTDTHWSEFGAYKILQGFFLSSYGIDIIELKTENFKMENVSGDLGSKLDGQKDDRLSYNFNIDDYEAFNSGLKNHGHGAHYINPMAPNPGKVLIFGDSFGISYIKPLVLTFKEVLFLYSPATFIEDIYEAFLPDFVILQINQRFLLEPPIYRHKIEESLVFKKIRNFDDNERKKFLDVATKEKTNSVLRDLYLNGLSCAKSNQAVSKETDIRPLKREIFNGDFVEVYAKIFDCNKSNIVITFTARSDRPQKNGFAEGFLEKNGISAIHFISKSNHWWQVSEMRIAVAKASSISENYTNVFTYGASMGAHGALIFSKALKANHIIAGSPQYAIKGRLTPWTPRWERDTIDINEIFPIENGIEKTAKIYCIFDPFNKFDRLHADKINELVNITRINISFSNHSAILQLKNIGVLSALLKAIIFDEEKISHIMVELKKNRLNNLNYLLGLGSQSSKHKYRNKVSVWAKDRALVIATENALNDNGENISHIDISAIFKSHCAHLIRLNQHSEAIIFAQKYCEKHPGIYLSHDLLSYVHWKAENFDVALIESKRALRLHRQNPSLRLSVIRLHLTLGQLDEALHHLEIALGFPSKDKKGWIALYKDLEKFDIAPETRLKVLDKVSLIDPAYKI